ncbi:hypothetical protein ACFVGY_11875 [Streptomyces sp. NPDC127106]
MRQAIGHEEAWQAVTLSAEAIKTIDSIGVEAAVAGVPILTLKSDCRRG